MSTIHATEIAAIVIGRFLVFTHFQGCDRSGRDTPPGFTDQVRGTHKPTISCKFRTMCENVLRRKAVINAEHMSSYIPLWVKSNYSFLEGASHPEELVVRAHELGLHALALTDRHGVYGIVRAHLQARSLGLKLLVGAELRVGNGRIVLLCKSREGYGQLCRLITRGQARTQKGDALFSLDEVCGSARGLVMLCPEPRLLCKVGEAFGDDAFALCVRHLVESESLTEIALHNAARLSGVRLVAGNEVLFHDATRKPLHDVLRCVQNHCTVATAGRYIRPNQENRLLSPTQMLERFEGQEELLEMSLELASRCDFSLSELRYRYPSERLPSGKTEIEWLGQLCAHGAQQRYPEGVPRAVAEQLRKELAIIDQLEYVGYFLTMVEVVRFCRERNILCQGRGSAANSAVCYCLGITAIDPVHMDLLFERFLSLERAEPPDIDLDIEHERREEVIAHIYDKYGRRHAAMVANVVRYRARSAIREVGKALGIPNPEIDQLAKFTSHYFRSEKKSSTASDRDQPFEETSSQQQKLQALGIEVTSRHRLWLELSDEIQGFPRHLSIHPGGFLLGHAPVDSLVPIEPATMEGRTVIQWDKQDVEDLGLFKVDLLGLGALTAVHRSFDLLRAHKQLDFNMATVPQEDPAAYAMIQKGDTVGTFQIESRAQMSMLPRLKPQTFYDLVVEVAIVRPGPIQGDMVHPYLRRREGLEEASYPHPKLRKVLQKTLGVPIFQEQVMKLAVAVADYTPGEADQLRRDMAAWRSRGRIEAHRHRLISRMIQNGIEPAFAERVFSQIEGFGEYGFPESHAASFALIAYVTCWLKCHHPDVFCCAMLNAQPMGFYSPNTLIEDAKRHGVTVLPIDINHSAWDCTLEEEGASDVLVRRAGIEAAGEPERNVCNEYLSTGSGATTKSPAMDRKLAVRMGLRYVKGLGQREKEWLTAFPGPHRDFVTFARNARFNLGALLALAKAGAFECFGLSRREAIWQVRAFDKERKNTLGFGAARARSVFSELTESETIGWDLQHASHSTRGHLMSAFRAGLSSEGYPTAEEVGASVDGEETSYIGAVICRQRPGTASGVVFFTLEDETGFVNLVVWSTVFEKYALICKTAPILGVDGVLQNQHGVTHLIARRLWAPKLRPDQDTPLRSRDFH